MTLHHDVHHLGYVDALNAALAKLPQLQEASAPWLLCHLREIPHEKRATVHHSAGGHVNHSLFWQTMTPDSTTEPLAPLRDALRHRFGSVAAVQERVRSSRQQALRDAGGYGWSHRKPKAGNSRS